MYESPIEFVTSELTKQLGGDVLTLAQSYGVRVDKDELIRALNYDRQQYEKGFADGKAAAGNWIPCEERLPEKTPLWKTVGYLATVTCDSWEEPRTMYVKWETTTVRGKEVSRWTFDNRLFPSEWHVVAWMPMPEAYKEGGEKI